MSERLSYDKVRQRAGRINILLGVSKSGAPLRAARDWIPGAVTLENSGYGYWSVAKVTNTRGGCSDLFKGKLRECDAFLQGMQLTLAEGKNV